MNLIFKPHPQDPAARVCILPGALVGGVGATDEQAAENYVQYINRMAACCHMTEQALAVYRGDVPIPGVEPTPAPTPEPPLIMPAVMLPRGLKPPR